MFTIVLETSGGALISVTCPFEYSKVKGLVSIAAKCLVRLGETLNESSPGIPLNSSNTTLEIYLVGKATKIHEKKINYKKTAF